MMELKGLVGLSMNLGRNSLAKKYLDSERFKLFLINCFVFDCFCFCTFMDNQAFSF